MKFSIYMIVLDEKSETCENWICLLRKTHATTAQQQTNIFNTSQKTNKHCKCTDNTTQRHGKCL